MLWGKETGVNTINDSYDVIIIGAGVGGGAMANRLARTGARVLMIERGNYLPREADNWSVKAVFHDRKYTAKETWLTRDGKPFNPSTFYYVGGNSKFFGAATVRFRQEDFGALQHEGGIAPAWPVTYDEFEPYYAEAERLMGTHGTAGTDPIEPPRSGPMPYPAIGHEPEIEAIATKLRARGLRPVSSASAAIDLPTSFSVGRACAGTNGRPAYTGSVEACRRMNCFTMRSSSE